MPDMQTLLSNTYKSVFYRLSGVKVKANRLSPPAPAIAPWAPPAAYLQPQIMCFLSDRAGERWRDRGGNKTVSQAKYCVHSRMMLMTVM